MDNLFAAHAQVSGATPGRKWDTDELNHAILLRLAAEFQGFARDLHDECVDAVVRALGLTNSRLEDIIGIVNLRANRKLDSGNASPGGLGTDFARLGMALWADLKGRYPSRATKWNRKLELLNTARNGIAHDDETKLQKMRSEGWPMTLPTARSWRSALDALADGMDTVCKTHLKTLLGNAPW
ncbi:hypothetical protein [Actinokineospora globicatena]|uniref:hypothetical protein n=1 Tax=Actinokineospora globicatena TaxID=103729 RepID=UPI0020A4F6B8|nr:hypothetical protein [Actinokineospora globicatena]MCP2301200.1 hypothetical protein [Actinokineospora globicatena]GLW77164.1 hypothetical protein Aglo01_16460 [Actinokineospora globicatena]GLW83998.1 hypothetical protein Aglo02_16380 [Actinokineospora globicatena]